MNGVSSSTYRIFGHRLSTKKNEIGEHIYRDRESNICKSAQPGQTGWAKAMGVENPTSGQDFIKALDDLIASIGCADLKMSAEGITEDDLSLYPAKVHEVLGGDITADPLPLSDEGYLTIFRKAYK